MPKGMRTTYDDSDEVPVNPPAETKVKLRAMEPYHNGAIAGGVGANWRIDEIREITPSQYKQLVGDNPRAFEIVR